VKRRIFMTATERRYRGKSDKILSMDDPAIYGDTFHLLSFKRALEEKPAILSDYRIVTILVSREEVAELIRKNVFLRPDKGKWAKEIEAEMLAALVALRKAMRKYPIHHAVSFHSSIRRAEVFKEHNDAYNRSFQKHGAVETFHVSGQTPTGTRARVVKEFSETERALITNARCLTEGVDVPNIDCVMFADPRRSAVDIVQAVGRALRPAKGKKMGYVIVPILHDAKAKPDDIFDSEEFQEILTTLRALAANDDRIIEYFRTVSQDKGCKKGGAVVFDVDEKFATRINLDDFSREIDLKCWSRLARLSWRPFTEARTFARSLSLKTQDEWVEYTRRGPSGVSRLPPDIPATPHQVYAQDGWINMGDWLGTGYISLRYREYRPFPKARAFVRKLKLNSEAEWYAFSRGLIPTKGTLPKDIPAKPQRTYAAKGWSGMGDWLGTGTVAPRLRQYRSFAKARAFARRLKLRSGTGWRAYCKGGIDSKPPLPSDIPANPIKTYAGEGWSGMGDWLGTGTIAPRLRQYRSFAKARAFARRLNLKSEAEWRAYCKGGIDSKPPLPSDIPANPMQTYAAKGWSGMGDWLGTGTIAPQLRQFRSFAKARAFVRRLKLKNVAEWRALCRGDLKDKGVLPPDIPQAPERTYANEGWVSTGNWLGTGTVAPQLREYRSFSRARAFARSLHLNSGSEWGAFCKGKIKAKGTLPPDIPAAPQIVYAGKGWAGVGDWLGTGAIANHRRAYRPFGVARSFARSLGLKKFADWVAFCRGQLPAKGKLPPDIPSKPYRTYINAGWISMGDWLGTERKGEAKRGR
jgi:hypothetical protein